METVAVTLLPTTDRPSCQEHRRFRPTQGGGLARLHSQIMGMIILSLAIPPDRSKLTAQALGLQIHLGSVQRRLVHHGMGQMDSLQVDHLVHNDQSFDPGRSPKTPVPPLETGTAFAQMVLIIEMELPTTLEYDQNGP